MKPATTSEAPFLRARDEWDNRYSNLSAARSNWRLFASALLLLDILLSVALFYLASTSRITPYVVEVDRHGHALAFGPAEELTGPEDRVIRFQLALLITRLRTVLGPQAAAAQRKDLTEAYAYLRPPASLRVANHYRRQNPFSPDANPVTVEVTSILQIEKNIWQVGWIETHFGRDGSRLRDEPWQAILHVTVSPPTKTDQLLVNPLGIFVTQLDWTKVLPNKEQAR